MDVQSLLSYLSLSYSACQSERESAGNYLSWLCNQNGATSLLLQGVVEGSSEVRLAAAINFKNLCRKKWVGSANKKAGPVNASAGGADGAAICDEDKAEVRNVILNVLCSVEDKRVVKALSEAVGIILSDDYPERWPGFVDAVAGLMTAGGDKGDHKMVLGALMALRKLVKRYEYKSRENRAPMVTVLDRTFSLLTSMMCSLIDHNTEEAALTMKEGLKVFWSCTQFDLPRLNKEQLQPWFQIFLSIVSKKLYPASANIPPLNQPVDPSSREKWIWWKLKKWSCQIISRLYSRYGNPKTAEEGNEDFARYFSTEVAPRYLGAVCDTLALRSAGEYCTDRVVMLCLNYLDTAIEQKNTWVALKPHVDFIVYKVCFNLLKLTPDDIEVFNNDPHEHINKQFSFMAEWTNARLAALTLLEDLVKFRTAAVADKLFANLIAIIQAYTANPHPDSHADIDAALNIIGALENFLINRDKGKHQQELSKLMACHVLPLLQSPVAFLRARACVMALHFAAIELDPSSTHFLIDSVICRLSDESLVVRVEASKAIRFLIEKPNSEAVVLPKLPLLLSEFFRLMNEVGNDDVVTSLDVVIEKYGDQMEPHAVALVENLASTFMRYIEAEEDEDEEGQAAMAATVCLECIATVLKSVHQREDIFKKVEPMLIPIIAKVLDISGDLCEFLEHALDLITFLTFYQDSVSPQMWSLFPLMFTAFHQFAFDYLPQMVAPIDNYVSTDMEGFCQGTTSDGKRFIELIYEVVNKVLNAVPDLISESDCRKALGLFLIVFQQAASKPVGE